MEEKGPKKTYFQEASNSGTGAHVAGTVEHSQFSLFMIVMLFKLATSIELVYSTEPLLLGPMQS